MDIAQFDYELPPDLIAQHPAERRDASRLLHLDAAGEQHDLRFTDLPGLLRPGDLLVFNNTRVIKARLRGHKDSGGQVEVLVERILTPTRALVHLRSSKSPRAGTRLLLADGAIQAEVQGRQGELFDLVFPSSLLDLLEQYGDVPLPPYITHAPAPEDEARYQTVYAEKPGAVAAPTAGLHFDQAMLDRLKDQGIREAFVTLHVGAGTFQPVRVSNISEHVMHSERYVVPESVFTHIRETRAHGGRVIAVGTTSVRSLEAAAQEGDGVHTCEGDTRLFITPGYRFRNVDALITNFHLPQSTLLMLVSALAGMEPIRRAYEHAVQSRYRFFSYGDAMFIEAAQSSPTPAP
ncbi:tRNA preQ1(34) S-adenosylmethionine ribosyltransferase-isomerase QueA [Castellaniella sp. UC4442_H9]|jgi:S-adenosylmethionine:tRNA ribosyltransferase-isomerase|nr:tRNA preQ1(34) S-adenosylmethionine ribosyltransferase-isomerase QueA [Castellaniella sp.]